MAATHFSGPLQTGTVREGAGINMGTAVLAQMGTLSFDATLVQSLTFTLPANASIQNIWIDTLTAYDSATSAGLTIGTAAAGTQYQSSVDVKTTGRETQSFSAAQLLAMSNITTNTSVVATVTSVGQPTAGSVRITVQYCQN